MIVIKETGYFDILLGISIFPSWLSIAQDIPEIKINFEKIVYSTHRCQNSPSVEIAFLIHILKLDVPTVCC